MKTRLKHLDAVQGKTAERSESYIVYDERVPQSIDAVMRQEQWQSFWLCQKVGYCDA